MSLIEVQGVWKSFDQLPVLRGIDLSVQSHQAVVLIGASGSGKSTLLRCLNGLESVDAGSIVLGSGTQDPVDISAPGVDMDAVRRRIGIVFQSYNLFPHLSVVDNVTLAPRKVAGVRAEQAKDEAMTLLSRFGLADKAGEYPDRLSGGQSQRVAIVRALALQPEVMLFDEITSALDPLLVGEVLDAVRELKAGGLTLVMEPINRRDIPGYFTNTTDQVKAIIDEVGAPHLKLQLDLYHMQVTEGDLQRRTEKLFPITAHVQIAGNPDRNEPDVGEANHLYLLDVLDRLGFQGYVGLEYKPRTTTAAGLGWAAKFGIKA